MPDSVLREAYELILTHIGLDIKGNDEIWRRYVDLEISELEDVVG